MRINFELQDLEVFLAVYEQGSFLAAASLLGLSQPSVTRRIQKLEESFTVKLFERTTRTVRPTLAGKRLHARAQAMLDDAQETTLSLKDETAQFEFQRNAIVTIAVVPSILPKIIPQAIKKFRQQGHIARIRILDRLANKVSEAVSEGEADFGISSIPAFESNTNFEPLVEDPFVLTMNKQHPLVKQTQISWQELLDVELIVPMKGTGNRMLIDDAIAKARKKLLWSYEVQRTSSAIELVQAGIGVAILPKSALPFAKTSTLVTRPISDPAISRIIGVVKRTNSNMSSTANALLQNIISTI